MTIIGDNAFASCYDLKSITYGEEPVNDGEYKFSAALKTVGGEAFKDNPLLRNFIVPDTIESIGTNAFYNAVQSGYHCKDVTVTFYYVNGVIAANILDSQYVWHIVVNDNIHTLSDKAFYNCPVLETISIPDTVSSVGTNVFANPGKNVTATFRGVDGTIDASVYRDNNCTFNVTVIDYIPGDINGDGIVNIKDITRLVNYLNDNSAYEVINKALDVNGDGVVSIKDVTRLEAYLNDKKGKGIEVKIEYTIDGEYKTYPDQQDRKTA